MTEFVPIVGKSSTKKLKTVSTTYSDEVEQSYQYSVKI